MCLLYTLDPSLALHDFLSFDALYLIFHGLFCSFFAVFSHYLHSFLSFSVPYILLSPLLILSHSFSLCNVFFPAFFLSLLHCIPFFLIPCSFFLSSSLTPSFLSPATFCLISEYKKCKENQVFFAVAQICSSPALFYSKTLEKSLYTATHFSNIVILSSWRTHARVCSMSNFLNFFLLNLSSLLFILFS